MEALFSSMAEVDHIEDFRANYRIDTAAVVGRYRRTIKSFSLGDSYKKRRHALRLALNLREALRTGRFNPTLTPLDAMFITEAAGSDDYFEILERMSI